MSRYEPPLPGAAVPILPREAVSPRQVAWWKQQLEDEIAQVAAEDQRRERRWRDVAEPAEHNPRRNRADDVRRHGWVSHSETDDDRIDQLRDALRAARRQLDASARRERALRDELRDRSPRDYPTSDAYPRHREHAPRRDHRKSVADDPESTDPEQSPPGRGRRHAKYPPTQPRQERLLGPRRGEPHDAEGASRPWCGGASARAEDAGARPRSREDLLGKGSLSDASPRHAGGRAAVEDVRTRPPADQRRAQLPDCGGGGEERRVAGLRTGQPRPPALRPEAVLPEAAGSKLPTVPGHVQPPRDGASPRTGTVVGVGNARGATHMDAAIEQLAAAAVAEVVAWELPAVVKEAIKGVIRARIPLRGGREPSYRRLEVGLWATMLTDVVGVEAGAVVREAVGELASSYVQRRAAERVLEAAMSEVVREEVAAIAQESRLEGAVSALLDEAMAPLVRETAVWAHHEARGNAARRREAAEREAVAEVAAESVVERLLLQRLLQHVASGGEGAMLRAEAERLLDEVLAEELLRHALATWQCRREAEASAVLGAVHRRLAHGTILEELVRQLAHLSPSGFDAPRVGGRAEAPVPGHGGEAAGGKGVAPRETKAGGGQAAALAVAGEGGREDVSGSWLHVPSESDESDVGD